MKLDEMKIKDIERKLNNLADVYYTTGNPEKKELSRGYCQGIGFVLSMLGYAIEWDNGKTIIVDEG